MRPAWRLAINSLSGRRSRSALLIATVALCAALIAAVTCALASVNKGISHRVGVTVGHGDARIQHTGQRMFDLGLLRDVQTWPEVASVVPRAQDALVLGGKFSDDTASPNAYGVVPDAETAIRPRDVVAGRFVKSLGEIAVDGSTAKALNVGVGDVVDVRRFGDPVSLKVVGVLGNQLLGGLARPEVYVTIEQLGLINEWKDKARELDIVLRKGENAEAFVERRAASLPPGMVLRTTSKVTSGLDQSMESSRIGMTLISSLAFLAASFIIMTGMTTGVTERQRELAVIRCIGGARLQLASSQLFVGFIIGAVGAVIGVPVGVAAAWLLISAFPDKLPVGFAWSFGGIALSILGAVGAGLAGGLWPAIQAARTSPLSALTVRARRPRLSAILLCGAVGLVGVGLHIAVIALNRNPEVLLYGDAFIGIPAMLSGYFLAAVPVTLVAAAILGPLVSRLMGLPPRLLRRTVQATPYRHGFTAAAMMVGLALLVVIWTNGRAVLSDWLTTMKFPDAFVFGRNLTDDTQKRIEQIPGVQSTCAITLQHMNPRGLWDIGKLRKNDTSFIAFEPEAFFAMAELVFDEGDPAEAKRRLLEGNAVLVAREYKVAKGIGVGSKITLAYEGKEYTFDVVGVVNSPGLDIVNSFFDIGEDYLQQSISAVFGSRKDLKEKFGNDAINLIQIALDPRIDDAAADEVVRQAGRVRGVIQAGSGRQIKTEIQKFISGAMLVFSVVGVCSMLVACLGVANLIIAGIQTRQFEFGVLRAVGAERGLLPRLVLGEAVIIAASASVLGTLMGMQGAWAGQRVISVLLGLTLKKWTPSVDATAAGWGAVLVITLLASGPAVWSLSRREPRELLAATKG